MPKLRPPGGRQAAAVTPEVDDEANLQGQTPESEQVGQEGSQDDPAVALRAQIAALEKSNKEYLSRIEAERTEKAEALRRAQEREAEVVRLQEQTVNSQTEAIEAALAAAQAEAEAAQRDWEAAASIGDTKAQSEAQRKMSRAEARIITLESGKEALEREAKERPKAEVRQEAADPLDKINLPPLAKQWLRDHKEYLYDERKNAKIQALHWDVVDEGHPAYSESYFEAMEQKLGLRSAPKAVASEEDDMDEEPVQRRASVSAPPSREVPGSNGVRSEGRITLTAAQKEAARISGISEKEYAAQLINLQKEKQRGNYA